MYNVKSMRAEEFIDDGEILASLTYAQENKNNKELIESVIEKASECRGLSHREAVLLLACDDEELNKKIYSLAKEIKEKIYGNRIVFFAPLYLSNYCINSCVYCPYHVKNKNIRRKKLTQEEVEAETIALQDMGHKRLALEAGEDDHDAIADDPKDDIPPEEEIPKDEENSQEPKEPEREDDASNLNIDEPEAEKANKSLVVAEALRMYCKICYEVQSARMDIYEEIYETAFKFLHVLITSTKK